MRQNWIILTLSLFLVGCWVKVEDPQEIQKAELGKQIVTPERTCFNQFKSACEGGDWEAAYRELSSRWRASRSLEQFRANMETVGLEHLKGARVITITQTKSKGKEKLWVTTVNSENNTTAYAMIRENGNWKIDGIQRPKQIRIKPKETEGVKKLP